MKEKENVVWINHELKDIKNDIEDENNPGQPKCTEKAEDIKIDTMFSQHMSKFIGQTITVYTTSGGLAGRGLTGVLVECTATYIRLVTHVGPAPEKPNRKSCRNCPYYKSCLDAAETLKGVGSVAEIPLGSLVIFVHNSL